MAAQPPTCERASAPRPQTVGKSLFQFRNRAREKKTAANPPAERSEANKVSIYLYMFSAEGEQFFFTYGGEAAGRAKRG